MENTKNHQTWLVAIINYFKRNLGTIIGLVLLVIVSAFATDNFFTSSNILNLLRANAVNAIICCGMLMAILLGQIDISVGSTVGLCGVIGAYLVTIAGIPVWLAVILCMVVGALIGLVNGFSIAYVGAPAFISTLATMSIGRGLAEVITKGVTIRVREEAYTKLGTTNIGSLSIIVIYAVVALFITWLLLNKTRFGYFIYAIGGNKTAAEYSGINVKRYNLIPYVISGLLAGIGGIIWSARLGSAAATLGNGFEMDAIAAVVIGGTSMSGGVGTVGGTVVGILIMGVLTNGLNLMGISSFWQGVFKGIIILIAVFIDIFKKSNLKDS